MRAIDQVVGGSAEHGRHAQERGQAKWRHARAPALAFDAGKSRIEAFGAFAQRRRHRGNRQLSWRHRDRASSRQSALSQVLRRGPAYSERRVRPASAPTTSPKVGRRPLRHPVVPRQSSAAVPVRIAGDRPARGDPPSSPRIASEQAAGRRPRGCCPRRAPRADGPRLRTLRASSGPRRCNCTLRPSARRAWYLRGRRHRFSAVSARGGVAERAWQKLFGAASAPGAGGLHPGLHVVSAATGERAAPGLVNGHGDGVDRFSALSGRIGRQAAFFGQRVQYLGQAGGS